MYSTLTLVRYPKSKAFYGFLSMALFHLFLRHHPSLSFYKLMGSGKNGTFDIRPDWQQWAILGVFTKEINEPVSPQELYGKKIAGWWQRGNCEVLTIGLEAIEGHGKWDGKECFGNLPKTSPYEGVTAVLTRATIRLSKVRSFWQNVGAAADAVRGATGFITSFGIGEVPWIKQATFSVWQSKADMKTYAYKMQQHQQVIQKTRKENWYKEELFVRFKMLWTSGALQGKNEIAPYLS